MTTPTKALQLLATRSTAQLVEMYELTEQHDDGQVVCEWIADVLERRDPAALIRWSNSADASPRAFYL